MGSDQAPAVRGERYGVDPALAGEHGLFAVGSQAPQSDVAEHLTRNGEQPVVRAEGDRLGRVTAKDGSTHWRETCRGYGRFIRYAPRLADSSDTNRPGA